MFNFRDSFDNEIIISIHVTQKFGVSDTCLIQRFCKTLLQARHEALPHSTALDINPVEGKTVYVTHHGENLGWF